MAESQSACRTGNPSLVCPVCGGHRFRNGLRDLPELRFAIAARFSVPRCRRCGTHVTVPLPDEAYLADLYRRHYVPAGYVAPDAERIATAVRGVRAGESGLLERWREEQSTEIPALFLDEVTGGCFAQARTVLDIGCYTGENMLWLRAAGWDVFGLEPNPEAARIARQLGLYVAETTLETAQLPAQSFDAAYLSYVIEHFANPRAALVELHRVLKPGGRVLITTHNVHSLWRFVFQQYWFHWHTPFHLFHTHPRALRRLAESCGFRAVQLSTRTPVLWLLYSIRATRGALLANCPNPALYAPVEPRIQRALRAALAPERAGLAAGDCTIAVFERR